MPPQLPLLAGPILRRVEPTLVSVWVALRERASVRLTLWQGHVAAGSDNVWIDSDAPTETLRVGAGLHIAVVMLPIPSISPRLLVPGTTYSYDLQFRTDSGTHTLKSLGLLRTGDVEGHRVEALGFKDGFLPSFALPPSDITDLRVVFGSCRRPVNAHRDALPWIDDLMHSDDPLRDDPPYSYKDPLRRPHQLFLGGDQIYADDVTPIHLHMLMDLGKELIGVVDGKPVEHLKLERVRDEKIAEPKSFTDYNGDVDSRKPGELPVDNDHFPPGGRFDLTTIEAQMTTTDADSHLFSLGEFAAMYLSVWSNAIWPEKLATNEELNTAKWPDQIASRVNTPRKRTDEALESHRTQLGVFAEGLPKVRRVLANIPTYMIFDDHDVTDDWYLNPIWRDRVLTTSLGVQIIRNALVAYALFQDWGNDPLQYADPLGNKSNLLSLIRQMFPANVTRAPIPAVAERIDALLGFERTDPDPVDGTFPETHPAIRWHFSVPGPRHLAIALDNRTRRSFVTSNGPPGNVALSAQADQIPAGPLPDKDVLLVIAPLQVLGPPLLDELIAPASYRGFDMKSYTIKNEASKESKSGSRGMAGTNPDAIEAWAFDPSTFESLLARLEPHRRVVLLSGDVHYSASNVMSYWKKGSADPARFVQFTSSGFKNVMPWYIIAIDRSMAAAQELLRSDIGADRMGWTARPDNPVVLPPGKSEKDIPRALRAKLRNMPTLLPTHGWPDGTTINSLQRPDWSWHVDPILDLRADAARPTAAKPLELSEATIRVQLISGNAEQVADAYQKLATRHQHAIKTLRNSRQILFRSNFGVVRFERRATGLVAIHEMYTTFRAPNDTSPDPLVPQAFVVHEAALTVSGTLRPEETLKPLNAVRT